MHLYIIYYRLSKSNVRTTQAQFHDSASAALDASTRVHIHAMLMYYRSSYSYLTVRAYELISQSHSLCTLC